MPVFQIRMPLKERIILDSGFRRNDGRKTPFPAGDPLSEKCSRHFTQPQY
jgi:hypothetical protein